MFFGYVGIYSRVHTASQPTESTRNALRLSKLKVSSSSESFGCPCYAGGKKDVIKGSLILNGERILTSTKDVLWIKL
jgi:hypothetical protein